MEATNLWAKLFQIQVANKGFFQTEPSEKKRPGTNTNEYNYTPGHVITGKIREMMDDLHLMMPFNIVAESHEPVTYPVYKVFNNEVKSFTKTEVLFTVTVDYSVIDVDTGERVGPIRVTASGANGIDKGIGSALSLAERYFFLKLFHIPTMDKTDEPDAHDCGYVPGIPDQFQSQFINAKPENIAGGYQAMGQPAPNYTPNAMPTMGQMRPKVNTAPQNGYMSRPDYQAAVISLSQFNRGTPTHAKIKAESLSRLNMAGYPTSDPVFQRNFEEDAQALREQRVPSYA